MKFTTHRREEVPAKSRGKLQNQLMVLNDGCLHLRGGAIHLITTSDSTKRVKSNNSRDKRLKISTLYYLDEWYCICIYYN